VFDGDGGAAIVSQVLGLYARAAGHSSAKVRTMAMEFMARLQQRTEELP